MVDHYPRYVSLPADDFGLMAGMPMNSYAIEGIFFVKPCDVDKRAE
jgi:hypothetical protein